MIVIGLATPMSISVEFIFTLLVSMSQVSNLCVDNVSLLLGSSLAEEDSTISSACCRYVFEHYDMVAQQDSWYVRVSFEAFFFLFFSCLCFLHQRLV